MNNTFLFSLLILLQVSCHSQTEEVTINPQFSMQDIVYPLETKKIQLDNGVEIAYSDEGSGDSTLLMIHGLGSYLPAWKNNIDGLKSKYRCIAVDLPGYGKSSNGNYDYGMGFFADNISAFIDALSLQNVMLIGHSMGGQIAMTMALDTDADIKKLILIAPAGFEVFSTENATWLKAVFTAQMVRGLSEKQIETNFAINFAANTLPDDARFMFEDRLQMIRTGTEYDAYVDMIPQCVSGMLDEPVFERIAEIEIPTLVIYGEQDHLIPNKFIHPELTTLDVAQQGHKQLVDSQLEMLSSCGHFVQWECADEVNALLLDFIEKE